MGIKVINDCGVCHCEDVFLHLKQSIESICSMYVVGKTRKNWIASSMQEHRLAMTLL